MLFNSWVFLPFLLIVLCLYYAQRLRMQNLMLLVASYVFYAAWDWRFLALLWISTIVDYVVGKRMHASRAPGQRKAYLLISCLVNLGILGFFKYFNFFIDSAASLMSSVGWEAHATHLNILLPVGISFYTFQTMSYTIDIYRGKLEPCRNLVTFALFVAFFPQLVAGPIERASRLLPQLAEPRKVSSDHLVSGGWLILWGLFKKVVVADNLASVVDGVFATGGDTSGLSCLLAIYAFAYQIYCDFSGYSDIARGVAKLMGIELMVNFNLPYLSRSPAEFWHRWHISLSTWLRDYLYIPLGGNRLGSWLTYRNLALTMLLGGLWHGAAWNFVIWGAYHGGLLAVHRFLTRDRNTPLMGWCPSRIRGISSCVVMFHLVCFGWLLFRAPDMGVVAGFVHSIATNFTMTADAAEMLFPVLAFPLALWAIEIWAQNRDDPRTCAGWYWGMGPLVVSLLIAALWLVAAPVGGEFIYFQF